MATTGDPAAFGARKVGASANGLCTTGQSCTHNGQTPFFRPQRGDMRLSDAET
jgi:hypothetical protein